LHAGRSKEYILGEMPVQTVPKEIAIPVNSDAISCKDDNMMFERNSKKGFKEMKTLV
jgi:hypothetical protein